MLLEHWDLVGADLISQYRCNPYDRQQRRAFTWSAARAMIGGLFATETRISGWYEQEYGQQQRGRG